MIYVVKDPVSHTMGYRIIENEGGIQRTLYEEFTFDHPGTLLAYVDALKDAFISGRYRVGRDNIGYFGVTAVGRDGKVIFQEDGYMSMADANAQVASLRNAIMEGQVVKLFEAQKTVKVEVNPYRLGAPEATEYQTKAGFVPKKAPAQVGQQTDANKLLREAMEHAMEDSGDDDPDAGLEY